MKSQERNLHMLFLTKPIESAVRLRMIHKNLLSKDIMDNYDTFKGVNNGWPAILSSLKSLLETGESLAFRDPQN